jgi:hypothetical protein
LASGTITIQAGSQWEESPPPPVRAAAGLAERIDSGGLGGPDAGALDLRLRGPGG